MKKRSKKAGLPPGTPVHIGETRHNDVKISVLDYDEIHLEEKKSVSADECLIFREKPTVTWINIEGLHKLDILEKIGECFGLHPLVLEDIVNTDQRPKMEDYGNYLYIVLRMLYLRESTGEVTTEQISLIVGENFVISFQEGIEGDVFNAVRERLRGEKGRLRKMGADYLAYSMIDAIVDHYFIVFERLGENIELLEDKLVSSPTQETLHKIHSLKKEMIFLRRTIWPLREVIGSLERGDSLLIKDATKIYLRDVYDHAIQVMDTIETFRDMVTGMLDIYLSSVSNRLNAVMKVLTIIATIFMPLTFIAGVYGMNFKYMPELEWVWGYPIVLLVMLIIGILMLVYFRRKKWL